MVNKNYIVSMGYGSIWYYYLTFFLSKYQLMDNLEYGRNIPSVPNHVVVEFKVAQENVTTQLQQMVAQIALGTGLKHVNVLSNHDL